MPMFGPPPGPIGGGVPRPLGTRPPTTAAPTAAPTTAASDMEAFGKQVLCKMVGSQKLCTAMDKALAQAFGPPVVPFSQEITDGFSQLKTGFNEMTADFGQTFVKNAFLSSIPSLKSGGEVSPRPSAPDAGASRPQLFGFLP